jgi:hypothetical protein
MLPLISNQSVLWKIYVLEKGSKCPFAWTILLSTKKVTPPTSASLTHLERLLTAGLVDRSILDTFREAVDRVRTTGWLVQKAADKVSEGESVAEMVLRERIRATTRVLTHLAAELEGRKSDVPVQGMSELASAAQRVLSALEK